MNPNLKIFFKQSVYFLLAGAVIAGIYWLITRFIDFDFSSIGSYLADGFLWFMMIGMCLFFAGLIIRTMWTGIMNRVDTIVMCCPDKRYDGVHIVASHYSPGGESSEGYSSYFHYYLDPNGKLYLSKKVENDGSKIEKSIQDLSEQTRLQLAPDESRVVRIGSYSDGDNNVTKVTVPLNKVDLHFLGYEGLIDYGFKVTCNVGNQTKWRVTI